MIKKHVIETTVITFMTNNFGYTNLKSTLERNQTSFSFVSFFFFTNLLLN